MATEGVIVTHANDATPNIADLFAGKSFLVVQRVPMRTSFLDRIRANGGRIVRLESQADYIIADHVRNDCPPKSLSYTFIEAAIKAGALPDPNLHRAGPAPGFVRTVGSTIITPKASRTPFTLQDDRDLWNWVQKFRNLGIHGIKGNEIYKQLEKVNQRHTFQSWRDRYVKKLMEHPPEGVDLSQNLLVPPTRPVTSQVRRLEADRTTEEEEQAEGEIGEKYSVDVEFLLENIEDILVIAPEDLDTVWAMLADQEPSAHLSADQWKRLYEEEALPAYKAKQNKLKPSQPSPKKRKARVSTPDPPAQDTELTTPELAAMKAKAARDRQPSPSVSQKRRRQTATPRGNTYGRKRAKADHTDIFANEVPVDNGAKAPDERLSKPLEASANQSAVELGVNSGNVNGESLVEPLSPGEEPLPTSELNRAARSQLIAEANIKIVASEPSAQSRVENGHQDTTTADAQEAAVPPKSLQLTEENLAHQQAEHGVKLTRTADLRENDENLSNYAEYLQKLVTGHTSRMTGQTATGEIRNIAELDVELESDREPSPELKAQTTSKPLQHGGDVTLGDAVNESPAQEVTFNGDPDRFFVMPSSGMVNGSAHVAEVNGGLPNPTREEITRDSFESVGLHESDVPGEVPSHIAREADSFDQQGPALDFDFPSANDHNIDPTLDSQDFTESGQHGVNEEVTDNIEIDLTLAEPDGGFDFSSQEQPNGVPSQHNWETKQPTSFDQPNVNGGITNSTHAALTAPNMSEDEEMEEAPAKAIGPNTHAALDTQAIYAAGPQQSDFSFPLPPASDIEESDVELPTDPIEKPAPAQQPTPRPTKSSRKRIASTTPRKLVQMNTRPEPKAPEPESVESFLARLTAAGYAPASLHNAIYRTSAQLQAAEVVAMSEKHGLPVPDLPMIWSDEEDAQVGTTDAQVFKALCERKGWEEYDLRLKFLQDWRAAQ
jgi:hypothetical protein